LASADLCDLWTALEVWETGALRATEKAIKAKEKAGGSGERGYFHWLAGIRDTTRPLEIHRRIRRLVREEAAKLG